MLDRDSVSLHVIVLLILLCDFYSRQQLLQLSQRFIESQLALQELGCVRSALVLVHLYERLKRLWVEVIWHEEEARELLCLYLVS